MAVIDPRYKVVSVRLSALEYAEAEAVSRTRGYRSLSSFARSAILRLMLTPISDTEDERAETSLQVRIEQLTAELKQLSERLNATADTQIRSAEPKGISK